MIFLFITCKNDEDARKLARTLVERRVAASASLFPVVGFVPGDGGVEERQWSLVLVETLEQKVQDVEDAAHAMYTTPRVRVVPMSRVNREYKEWVSARVR